MTTQLFLKTLFFTAYTTV